MTSLPPAPTTPACALDRWLAETLRPRDAEALRHAYRLLEAPTASQSIPAPLRDIAAPLGVSRERARQLLARALSRLAESAAAPTPALDELLQSARALLRRAHGTLRRDDAIPAAPAFGAAAPWPVLRLLADILPAPAFLLHRDFLTLASADLADAAESYFLAALRAATTLLPLAELADAAPDAIADALPPRDRQALFAALALAIPGVVLTRDGRVALVDVGLPDLLCALLADRPDSTLSALVQAYNLLVFPRCQLGLGHVRLHLLRLPSVIRPTPNHYRLAEPHQPALPLNGTPSAP